MKSNSQTLNNHRVQVYIPECIYWEYKKIVSQQHKTTVSNHLRGLIEDYVREMHRKERTYKRL